MLSLSIFTDDTASNSSNSQKVNYLLIDRYMYCNIPVYAGFHYFKCKNISFKYTVKMYQPAGRNSLFYFSSITSVQFSLSLIDQCIVL